jgi:uncharacterized protein (TIGR02271 family)
MTDKTIVALYDDRNDAERAADDLAAAGFDRDGIAIDGGAFATTALGATGEGFNAGTPSATSARSSWAGDFSNASGRLSSLTRLGVPQADAEVYAEGVRRGGSLLVMKVAGSDVDRALEVIERHSPVDIENRGSTYRQTGWSGYDATLGDYDEVQVREERTRHQTGLGAAAAGLRAVDERRAGTGLGADSEEVIPVVEEQVHVGKREVERGRVHVRSRVVETPVEETVSLRDESVTVERRAVDRPAADVPADAFRERDIEVTETDEQAVVGKEARVVEEVVVRKDSAVETETVRDTVRRTEVEVDDDRTEGAALRRTDDRTDRTDI